MAKNRSASEDLRSLMLSQVDPVARAKNEAQIDRIKSEADASKTSVEYFKNSIIEKRVEIVTDLVAPAMKKVATYKLPAQQTDALNRALKSILETLGTPPSASK